MSATTICNTPPQRPHVDSRVRPRGQVAASADDKRSTPYHPQDRIAGKYRLLRLLAEGGMGHVWIAQHLMLDRLVALKIIKPEATAVDRALTAEARTLAHLEHPSIVRVHDCGTTGLGHPFLVMELLPGISLREALASTHRMPATRVVQLMAPLLDALEYCHKQGYVHRDLKPGNIFLRHLGEQTIPVLLDFGVALQPGPEAPPLGLGTLGYMPLEQLRGERVDARADVFGLCAVMYELISGRLPYLGEDIAGLQRAMARGSMPDLASDVPAAAVLGGILRRGLAPNAADRFASIAALRAALGEWTRQATLAPTPARPRRKRRDTQYISLAS